MEKSYEIKTSQSVFILFLSLFLCGCISVWMGKDLGYDLANYHFSNPYGFLHHRLGIDYWPATFPHAYFSPTADFLTYFLITYFSSWQAVFISGAIHGVNLWLLFLIATYFLPNNKYQVLCAFLIALIGLYGPIGFVKIGNFQTDHLVSIFVLGFVVLQIKALRQFKTHNIISLTPLLLGNILLGVAIGLKLTAALFAVGEMLAWIFLIPINKMTRIKLIFLASIAILIGDLMASGYWMMSMWQHFHNPIYPYFNSIFNYPSAAPLELNEGYTRIKHEGILKTIFYPFYFSFVGTGEGKFRDFRFMLVYIFLLLTSLNFLIKRPRPTVRSHHLPALWLVLFFVGSYIVGQLYFASIRYMLALEMLAPLVIYLLMEALIPDKIFQITTTIIILYLLALNVQTTDLMRWGDYQHDYFNVKLPPSIQADPDAMVLIAFPAYALDPNPPPINYMTSFLPAQWQYVGMGFLHGKFITNAQDTQKIRQLISNYSQHFYLLTSKSDMPALFDIAKQFGLIPAGACSTLYSSRQSATRAGYGSTIICPVSKA